MVDDLEIKARIEGVGRRIAEGRDLAGLDQQSLAHRSGVSRVMLSDFERGARTPSVEHLFRICDGGGFSPSWLLTGVGEALASGPSQDLIRDEANHLRDLEIHFVEAINSLFRRYRTDSLRRTWALGACIKAYWGAHWLGYSDMKEVAQIVEKAAGYAGLDLIEVLVASDHCNAAQYLADWLMHRNVDPGAFGMELQADGYSYQLKYFREMARTPEALLAAAKKRDPKHTEKKNPELDGVLGYLMSFVRILNPSSKKE